MKRLTFLFSTTIVMVLVSCLIASPASATTITVRALGTVGSEAIRLTVNNTMVKSWTLTTSMADYTASTDLCGNCRVVFLNYASGRSVQVDYIIVDGNTLQAEDQEINTGCSSPYSEWLYCNGYIDFGIVIICPTLSVSPTSLSLTADANSDGAFDITSDTSWTVSSNQTWLTVNPTSGSNNGTITVTAQANMSLSPRTATVTVSGTGVSSKTVTVTQPPVFSVSPTELNVGAAENSSSSFNISSSRSWTVSSDQTWLTVSPTSGSNNGTVTVTAQQNNTGAARTATVTVSATGVTPQTVTVGQSGSVDASYEIGTWSGFRTAAITYTFDDGHMPGLYNTAIPMFNEPNFNYKLTAYPVINWCGSYWSNLQAAAAQGHEIGSHTVSHNLSGLSNENQIYELSQSQTIINSYIPGNQCITIAYPGCSIGNQSLIDDYYIAGRTCTSATPNPATPTNFYMIQSTFLGTMGLNTISSITTLDDQAAGQGGWVVFTIHALDDDSGYSPLSSTILRQSLDYLAARRSTFWVQTFLNVVKYIKERNDASVSEISNTGDTITVSVTDTLSNTIYNYPITIRRPLPTDWPSATATQNGQAINAKTVVVNSTLYVMFDAVPDGGDVVLTKSVYGDFIGTGIVDINDLSAFFGFWMVNDCSKTAGVDLDEDCTVNFYEFAVLAENWLIEP
jgi:peptidoglycan-N-acetylglucosamine deacetylase